jgi:hypothetical protein
MSFNLIRNARMFFTTNVNTNTGVVNTTGFDATNTKEIQVLDGLSFSQNTGSETVTLNEAGTSPVRGQRSFNTSLEPVELTFSTYMRPYFNEGSTSNSAFEGDDVIDAEEDVLWNAFAAGYVDGSAELIGGASAAWTKTVGATGVAPVSTLSLANSAKNQMQRFGVIIVLDGSSYVIDNCVLDQATIDFGLDAIATIAWTARGSVLRNAAITANTANPVVFSGTYFTAGTNQSKAKNTTAPFLANKLSTVAVTKGIGATGQAYTLALTGGSITLSNNVTYLTPANLGVVNKPVTYFTGTRAVSGTINCYLRTGATNSAGLLSQMLTDSATDVDPEFQVELKIGGTGATRVELLMPACVLTIPTINTEQVISTAINFTAQGSASSAFAIDTANEITVKYYSANTTV